MTAKLHNIISFYKTVIGAVAAHGTALAISFIGSVMLTQALGADGRGVVGWIISFTSIGIILSQAGMGHTNRRFVAGKEHRAAALFSLTVIICGTVSLFISVILGAIAFNDIIGQQNRLGVILALLIIPMSAISVTSGEMLIGLQKNRQYNFLNIAEKVTNTLLIIILIVLGMINPLNAVVAILIAALVRLLFVLYFLRHDIRMKIRGSRYILTHIGNFTFFNYIASSALTLSAHIITIFLGSMSSTTQAGWFAANMIIINAMRQLANTTGMFALPRLVRMDDYHERGRLKKWISIITFILIAGAALLLTLVAEWLIPTIFGEDFTGAVESFIVLMVGLVFCSMLFTFQSFIASDSKSFLVAIAPMILLIGAVTLGIVLIPEHGALGASYSWAIAQATAALISGIIAAMVHVRNREE